MSLNDLVVIVEDDPHSQQIFAEYMQNWGYEYILVERGDLAARTIAEYLPKLAIIDLSLPGQNGWRVLEAIRSNPQTRDVAALTVTAFHDDDLPYKAKAAGFIGCLPKPFPEAEFYDLVSTVMQT